MSPPGGNTHPVCGVLDCKGAMQAWSQKMKTGMSKRAASGEPLEQRDDSVSSPRMEQRSHGIEQRKSLHHGATAYPSEMQLQQVSSLTQVCVLTADASSMLVQHRALWQSHRIAAVLPASTASLT